MELNQEILNRVYEDIKLGLFDDIKDPERYGNLIVDYPNGESISVTVPNYVSIMQQHPDIVEKYIEDSNRERKHIEMLRKEAEGTN